MKVKGFTLIEVMVVVVIIAILVTSALLILKPAKFLADTRDARRQSDLKVVQTALEQYYAQNYTYPAAGSLPFGASWSPYLRQVPNDPDPSKNYCYNFDSVAKTYELCAKTETKITGSADGASVTCPAASFNYCLTNPF